MAKLSWNTAGERYFEAGVDRGVLYPQGERGVAWNGLIGVDEKPKGGDVTPFYNDGIRYYNHVTTSEYEANIEAFTYPDEFTNCLGIFTDTGIEFTGQDKKYFGLSYRTLVGNDIQGSDYGYKIHIIYNAIATDSGSNYQTSSESPEAVNFSWPITALPIVIPGVKPTAHIILNSTKMSRYALNEIEAMLYGHDNGDPRLPNVDELLKYAQSNFWDTITADQSGVLDIRPNGNDLMGDIHEGIYSIPVRSRFKDDDGDGVYVRSEN